MNALDGVGAILGEHDRFADVLPEVQFDIERMAGRIKIAAQVVPAVVAVDAHHIHGSFGDVGRVVVLAAYQCDRPVLRVAGVRQLIQRTKVVIRLPWTFPVAIQSRFIGDRPHHYARVVLVARNHASNRLAMPLRDQRIRILQPTHAHCRHLVDDYDAFAVAQIVHAFRIRIVTGSERVRVQPVNQGYILDVEYVIGATAVEVAVLMLAESLEIERFAVDEECCAAHFDRAYAECLPICVDDAR